MQPSEHFGISQSFAFITVWSTRMQMLIDDGSEINWKKLILLPLILFDCNVNDSN